MARRFAQTRPIRQAGFLYRKLRQSPPLVIALAIHLGIILILMSITIESELPDVILSVDVSKVLAEKIEKPPQDIIEAPEMPQNVNIENPQIDFSAPQDMLQDTNIIGDVGLIAGDGIGIVAPIRPGGAGAGFSDQVRKYRRGGLDVVFVVDTTWTLREFIERFKTEINNMITVLDKLVGARCRIGIVCYRDKAGGVKIKTESPVAEFYHTKTIPLTNDRQKLRDFVQSMGVGPGPKTEEEAREYAAGKGIPANEDVYEGLRLAAEMPWGETAKRVIILMGDAMPHSEDVVKIQSLIATFKTAGAATGGAAIHSIYSEPPMDLSGLYGEAKRRAIEDQKKDIERVYATFRDIARRGGGEAVSIENAKEVVRDLLVFAFGPDFRKNVDEVYRELGIFKEPKTAEEKKEGAGG